MDRRGFIRLFSGAMAATMPGVRQALGAPRRVGVVGGGIIGGSIAYHLVKRGADVTLMEKVKPAAGATANSFAWVNATFSKRPRHYHHLNHLGALGYRHLERELEGALEVQWGGSLEWYGESARAMRLREQVTHHEGWGYPTRLLEAAEFEKLEPNVAPGEVAAASWSWEEGSLDPVRTAETLVEKAKSLGARVLYPCEVQELDARWGRLRGVTTSDGPVELDALVIAAGVDTPAVARKLGIEVPLIESPGVLAHAKPAARLINRVVLSPGAHMKQKLDGRLVAGMGFGSAPVTEASREEGERVLESGKEYLPGIEGLELERVTIGYRPLPRDGYPIIGFPHGAPDVYLAVMHSGVTLTPIVGRLAAAEILDGVEVDLLENYRLERFTES